jgi:hypothetical protein
MCTEELGDLTDKNSREDVVASLVESVEPDEAEVPTLKSELLKAFKESYVTVKALLAARSAPQEGEAILGKLDKRLDQEWWTGGVRAVLRAFLIRE